MQIFKYISSFQIHLIILFKINTITFSNITLQKIIGESSKFYNADPLDFHSTIPHDEYTDEMALDCSKYAAEILDKVKVCSQ